MSTLIEFADKLKAHVNIVSVVEEYVQLRSGGANLKGLCPFHREKTPSFTVSPAKQIFHCFGCNEGGDVIKFVQKVERIEWIDSLRLLAERSGLAMPKLSRRSGRGSPEHDDARERQMAVHKLALEYFANRLQETTKVGSGEVLAFLKKRKLDHECLQRFMIGLADDSWTALLDHAIRSGYEQETLVAAGLASVSSRTNNCYDRFRKRIIFPICDNLGRPIAFGGRVYVNNPAPDDPKYVNSPETVIYRKGLLLYALHLAKEPISRQKCCLLMEGYMDVIRAHQYGFTNAVATCGTALTDDQARALRRLCKSVILVYDGDEAGQKAMLRACEILLEHQSDIRVAVLPAGHDPDSILLEHGAEAFRNRMEGAVDFMDFCLETAASHHNRKMTAGKVEIVDFCLPFLRKVANPVAQNDYVRRVAEFLSIEDFLIHRQLRKNAHGQLKPLLRERIETAQQDEGCRDILLLKLIIESPAARNCLLQKVEAEWLQHPVARKWFAWCQSREAPEDITWELILNRCQEDEDARFLRCLALRDDPLDESERTLNHLASRMQFNHARKRTQVLSKRIEESSDSDAAESDVVELVRNVDQNSPVKELGRHFFIHRTARKSGPRH